MFGCASETMSDVYGIGLGRVREISEIFGFLNRLVGPESENSKIAKIQHFAETRKSADVCENLQILRKKCIFCENLQTFAKICQIVVKLRNHQRIAVRTLPRLFFNSSKA